MGESISPFYLLTTLSEGIALLDRMVIENSSLAFEITAPILQHPSAKEDDVAGLLLSFR